MNKRKDKPHYVSNKDLYEAVKTYIKLCNDAEKMNEEIPQVPEYIAECIWKIANKIATKPNFTNYTYKEDMILDGVECCLRYIRNFNPDKSTNPFSYFTQTIYYAFLRRIEKEKRHQYLKYKSMENALLSTQSIGTANPYDTSRFALVRENIYDNILDFIEDYEDKQSAKSLKKKQKRKPSKKPKPSNSLELFLSSRE